MPDANPSGSNTTGFRRFVAWVAHVASSVTVRVISGVLVAYILGWLSGANLPRLLSGGHAHVILKSYTIDYLRDGGGSDWTYEDGDLTGSGGQTGAVGDIPAATLNKSHAILAHFTVKNEADTAAHDCKVQMIVQPRTRLGEQLRPPFTSKPFSLAPMESRSFSLVFPTFEVEEQFRADKARRHLWIYCLNSPYNMYAP